MISPELRAQVSAWIADDPDQRDAEELRGLLARAESSTAAVGGADAAASLAQDAAAELADRFAGRLRFGTAGLRGAVGAGPNRMNRAVVRATTAALAAWLLARGNGSAGMSAAGPEAAGPGPEAGPGAAEAGTSGAEVVIGWDARHRSAEFAEESARVLAGAGIRVRLLPGPCPTPLLAFAVRHLGAAAGVMITASHNPAADNGYKLYSGDGAQIIPPADAEIESAIDTAGPLAAVRLAPPDSPLIAQAGDEVATAYLDAVCKLSPAPSSAAWLRFVYTPLHGVAGSLALRAFEQAGYPAPDVVAAQAEPDPDFPTVAYPNPEHPGTLDLAIAQGRRTGADLALASDPDGDRLAVAVPDPSASGGWRALTGDQVGALLGAYLLERTAAWPDPGARLVVSTVVSATLLASIARAAGAQYAQTLTGFKWIVRAGDSRPGSRFVLGYEEALGYAVGDVVRDKDGIGAALALLGLAARARAAGDSLLDAYDALEAAHGVHLTGQLAIGTPAAVDIMARLRAAPPSELGGMPVTGISDFTGGTAGLPSADVLAYHLRGARVVIRPSGTEPMIKAYLQVVEPVTGGRLDSARAAARARLKPLQEAVAALLSG
jgi:phosphomannomutase